MSDGELVYPAFVNGVAMGLVIGVVLRPLHDGFGFVLPLVGLVLITYAYVKEKRIKSETAENTK